MNSNKMLTRYVSEIDCFLQDFDRQHPGLSLSQKKEIAKHERVYRLRDHVEQPESPNTLWKDF